MNEKQKARYNEIRINLERIAKEMRLKYVRENKDVLLIKLEEAIELWEEKDKIKPLKFTDKAGLKFLKSQEQALKLSQSKGWSKQAYKDEVKRSRSDKDLKDAIQ